ncbi:MAG: hypothetical protein JW999_03890 [Methanotrichaceae archaeon]|nr:hypothetical protein [Methanotrichaceae archaeon]
MKTEMEYSLLSHHFGDIQTFHQKAHGQHFYSAPTPSMSLHVKMEEVPRK